MPRRALHYLGHSWQNAPMAASSPVVLALLLVLAPLVGPASAFQQTYDTATEMQSLDVIDVDVSSQPGSALLPWGSTLNRLPQQVLTQGGDGHFGAALAIGDFDG